MIHTDFKGILISKNNGKQSPDEPYSNKYQDQFGCSYDYKLICIDDQFS